MTTWKAALVACVLLMAMAPAGANQGQREPRAAEAPHGWEAVGRLNLGPRGFCTGSLVTFDVVLTAAHCLFDDNGARLDPARVTFRAGLRDGRAEADRGVRRIVLHPAYDVHDARRLPRVGNDLALVELDRPVRGAHVRPFRTGPALGAGERVAVRSYARRRAEASREEGCEVLARDASVLVLSCTVDFGASGAPVFAGVGGERRIASVISAKAVWEGRAVSLAAAMEGELDVLLREFARTAALAPVGARMAALEAPGG